jgi:hypothetical protein
MKLCGHVACKGRRTHRQLLRNLKGITLDLREIRLKGMDWIHLARDRTIGGFFKHGNKSSGYITDGTSLDYLNDYKLQNVLITLLDELS